MLSRIFYLSVWSGGNNINMAESTAIEHDSDANPSQSTRAARYLELYDLECPTNEVEMKALASQYGLKHGDIVSFDDYRDIDSYFAVSQDDGTITLIRNPDDSCSGYLTVPKEVLASVNDALDLYRDVVSESEDVPARTINMTLSPHDKFVTDRFGHEVPADFLFDVAINDGEVTDIDIQAPGCQWDSYESDSITRELFEQRYLSGSPIVSVCVWVDLTNNNEYERYVAKYGTAESGDSQFPEIPSGWLREMYPKGKCWGWRFHGPQSKREEAEKSIREFLDGFTYQFVDSLEPFLSSDVVV